MTIRKDDPQWRTRLVVPPEKLSHYLLRLDHPEGGGKAKFFASVGFHPDNADAFAAALLMHGRNAPLDNTSIDEYGRRYVLIGGFHALDGKCYTIKSVWVEDRPGSGIRLVTAYPSREARRRT